LSKKGVKFTEAYKLGAELGAGAFSVVNEGTHKASGMSFAIKVVTKAKLTPEDASALHDEIAVLKELKHTNIIRLYDVFEEPKFFYLVTEKMSGGELFDRIVQKSYYNEKEARDTCRILFETLEYCHKHQVAHRDLKPENLLLQVRTKEMIWSALFAC
jgi:calcium/calmodulin-dependent protein kinase I